MKEAKKISPFDEIVMSSECGSFATHEPHVIHKGFLGIGRVTCAGYTHKHLMRLKPLNINFMGRPASRPFFLFVVSWECHCGYAVTANKTGFYNALLGKPHSLSYMDVG